MSQTPNTLAATSVMPSLTVNHLQQSLDFFAGLGFEVEDRWEHEGKLLGAMLKAGSARLGLSQDDGKKGTDRVKGVGVRIYIEADGDINAVAARAKAAGVALSKEPHDTEWGTRAFEVVEPSGFLLDHLLAIAVTGVAGGAVIQMSDEIWRWDATRMAEAIARRQISSREAVEACLARMAAVNPRLNAVTVDLSAPAREAADRADAAVARGDALGPLHGVPVTVKENIDQAGCATTNGVVAFRDSVATEDSPVVQNWTAAGAIILGRTNTPGFSFRLDTENDLRGRTWSPWSQTHTPGGSSGGAASSVAAGITPLSHGNDIAGSIRYPAYACGLAGLRPSFGRVPAFNPSAPAERSMSSQLLSVQGPLARTVRDIRLAVATLSPRDLRDPWWVDAPLEGPPPPRPIRVAVVTEPDALGGARLHPTVAEAMRQAAGWLADAGYEVVDVPTPGFTRAMELWFAMQLPEIRMFLWPAIEQYGDLGIRRAMRLMLDAHPADDGLPYMKALAERARVVRQWQRFLERVPLVLAPVCTQPVYAHGFDVHDAERTAEVWRDCVTLTAVPVMGVPALAVPTGVVDGLPTGVTVLAARFREDLCLAAGEAIEARAGMAARVPMDIAW